MWRLTRDSLLTPADDEFKPADREWFTTQGSPSGR